MDSKRTPPRHRLSKKTLLLVQFQISHSWAPKREVQLLNTTPQHSINDVQNCFWTEAVCLKIREGICRTLACLKLSRTLRSYFHISVLHQSVFFLLLRPLVLGIVIQHQLGCGYWETKGRLQRRDCTRDFNGKQHSIGFRLQLKINSLWLLVFSVESLKKNQYILRSLKLIFVVRRREKELKWAVKAIIHNTQEYKC